MPPLRIERNVPCPLDLGPRNAELGVLVFFPHDGLRGLGQRRRQVVARPAIALAGIELSQRAVIGTVEVFTLVDMVGRREEDQTAPQQQAKD